MKKDRWCEEFNTGRCTVTGIDIPSLAKKETEIVKLDPEKIELTDRNSILNFLGMFGFQENLRSGKILLSVVVTIPRNITQEYLKCSASNCRNKQRQCSHYK